MRRAQTATRLGAAFMLGVTCSLWLFPVVFGPQVQGLRLQRDEARVRAERLEGEIAKLKESLQSQQGHPSVKRVQVQIEGPDHRVVLEAERRIAKQLTEQYAGRPIDDISSFLLARRVQGSIQEIDGVRYQLDVELMIVGPELSLYGVLAPVKGG
jgi:hypothetical protein